MDSLCLLRGLPLKLTDNISIKHPTLNEIADMGFEEYCKLIDPLTSLTLDVADILWKEMNIWYEDIESEWMFFVQKAATETGNKSVKILNNGILLRIDSNCITVNPSFRDSLNFFLGTTGEYVIIQKKVVGSDDLQIILYNAKVESDDFLSIDIESSFKFTEHFYNITYNYIREINWIHPNYLFLTGGNRTTKEYILDFDVYRKRKKKKKESINLNSIVSSLIAKGQSSNDIWSYPIYLVYDIYYRLNKIQNYDNVALGYYTGNLGKDPKHPINWEKVNWSNVLN